jgi:hypothetical protein
MILTVSHLATIPEEGTDNERKSAYLNGKVGGDSGAATLHTSRPPPLFLFSKDICGQPSGIDTNVPGPFAVQVRSMREL